MDKIITYPFLRGLILFTPTNQLAVNIREAGVIETGSRVKVNAVLVSPDIPKHKVIELRDDHHRDGLLPAHERLLLLGAFFYNLVRSLTYLSSLIDISGNPNLSRAGTTCLI